MPLSDIATITITSESAKVQRAGFGIPLILSTLAAWAERTRTYTDLAGMVADGFVATSPEYLMASKLFGQEPSPEKIMVGRLANKPTQRFKITVKTVENSKKYSITIGAEVAEFTADSSATNDEIVAGLVAAINALTVHTMTASAQGSAGSQYVQLLADAAGSFHAVQVDDVNYLEILQDHADPGVATDLAAIALESSTWYALLNAWNSKAMVQAIAAWVETNKKLFLAQTVDTAVISTAESGTDDVAEALDAADYARTALYYSQNTGDFVDAAVAGRVLQLEPGSETWEYKTLAGVTARPLTATHIVNLKAKSSNYYETVAGVNVTRGGGVVAAGEYIDTVRGRDWLEARIAEGIFEAKANADKIPFTDGGVSIITGIVRNVLQEGVNVGLLSNDPAPKVTAPKVSTVSAGNKAARHLPDVKFDAILAGAIHTTAVSGSISV